MGQRLSRGAKISSSEWGEVFLLETEEGRSFVLKLASMLTHPLGLQSQLVCAAKSLLEIKNSKTIRVPEILYADENALVLELISASSPNWEGLSRNLGALHKVKGRSFGFTSPNWIGGTP